LKGQERVLSWQAILGVAVKNRHLESFKAGGEIVTTGGKSCNWTRDASNPAGKRAVSMEFKEPFMVSKYPLASGLFGLHMELHCCLTPSHCCQNGLLII
jgi:hypothetical protein